MRTQTSTYEVRLSRGDHESALADVASYMSKCEKALHVRLRRLSLGAVSGSWSSETIKTTKNTLKRDFLAEFGLTSRQYNSLLRCLEGRYKSLQELATLRIEKSQDKLSNLEKKIEKRTAKLKKDRATRDAVQERALVGKAPTKAQEKVLLGKVERDKLRFANHNQKRRIGILQERIRMDQQIAEAAVPPVVFGSKKRLRERAKIHPNDQQGLVVWRRKWEAARQSQFLVIGSKGENSGCQTCVLGKNKDGQFYLSLRLPNALKAQMGTYAQVPLTDLPERVREALEKALDAHVQRKPHKSAIAYRFIREAGHSDKTRLSQWRLLITLDQEVPEIPRPAFMTKGPGAGKKPKKNKDEAIGQTDAFIGAIGVDLNADHLAYAAIDRFGNPIRAQSGKIPLHVRGKTSERREALIGDAVAEIVRIASRLGLPIVIEILDFKARKKELKDSNAGYARMLSALPYSQIQTMLRRRAEREAVELVEVNPAYTSVIGRVNYSRRYGISVHIGASVAIARRAACLSERVNYIYSYRGCRNALPAPAEARRHVWRQWAGVRKELAQRDSEKSRIASGSAFSARSRKGRDVTSPPDAGGRHVVGVSAPV